MVLIFIRTTSKNYSKEVCLWQTCYKLTDFMEFIIQKKLSEQNLKAMFLFF